MRLIPRKKRERERKYTLVLFSPELKGTLWDTVWSVDWCMWCFACVAPLWKRPDVLVQSQSCPVIKEFANNSSAGFYISGSHFHWQLLSCSLTSNCVANDDKISLLHSLHPPWGALTFSPPPTPIQEDLIKRLGPSAHPVPQLSCILSLAPCRDLKLQILKESAPLRSALSLVLEPLYALASILCLTKIVQNPHSAENLWCKQ